MDLMIPLLQNIDHKTEMENISSILDGVSRHQIQQSAWTLTSSIPKVSFCIAHANNCILLKYFVNEPAIRIVHYTDNSPVHEDSCVEFFLAFNNDEEHYNLEFNCAGTCLMGFGKNSSDRKLINEALVHNIRRFTRIIRTEDSRRAINWELTLMIPLSVFAFHKIDELTNRQGRVNFFKCGDKLPEPHFLSWKNIESANPDFHLPQFFGSVHFQ
ncbi:MAG: hypothetical protein H7Y42_19070 [Chitinophagaceae bacterium]|nr:hypothetical protein [Chitinophagaceae bacterium]